MSSIIFRKRGLAVLTAAAAFAAAFVVPSSRGPAGGSRSAAFALAPIDPTAGNTEASPPAASQPSGPPVLPNAADAREAYLSADRAAKAGKIPEAQMFIEKVIGLEPAFLPARMDYAQILMRTRQPQAAVQVLREVLIRDPKHISAMHMMGVLMYQNNQAANGMAALVEAMKLVDKKDARMIGIRKDLGDMYMQGGRLMEAVQLWGDAVKDFPNDAEGWNNLGVVNTRLNDFASAEKAFKEAVRLNPRNVDAQYNFGLLQMQQWKLEEAETRFKIVLELNRNYLDAIFGLGRTFYRMKHYADAAAAFQQVIIIKPDIADAHYELGMCLLRQGQAGKAVGSLNEALRHYPNHTDAHYQMGLAFLAGSSPRPDLALAEFAAVARARPDNPDPFYRMAHCYKKLGQTEQALASFREALRLRPDWPEAMNDLAWILATHPEAKFRNPSEATFIAGKAYEMTSERLPAVLDSLAAAKAASGDFDRALELQKQAVKLAQEQKPVNEVLVKDLTQRLEPYARKQAWIQPLPTTQPTTRPTEKVADTNGDKGK